MPGLSPRMKVKKGRPLVGFPNVAPVVTLTLPIAGNVSTGTPFPAAATALDAETGNLSTSIVWTASVDGIVGTGAAPLITLTTLGAQTLTASVADSFGTPGSASVALTVII